LIEFNFISIKVKLNRMTKNFKINVNPNWKKQCYLFWYMRVYIYIYITQLYIFIELDPIQFPTASLIDLNICKKLKKNVFFLFVLVTRKNIAYRIDHFFSLNYLFPIRNYYFGQSIRSGSDNFTRKLYHESIFLFLIFWYDLV